MKKMSAEELWKIIESLERWIELQGCKGYEPFDALLSPVRKLACKNSFAERILLQAVRQCPVNIRPLLGIKPHESSMARGCIASGYVYLGKAGKSKCLKKADFNLEWLMKHKSPFFSEYSWGHHFDWVSRAGPHPMHMPTIVWTSLIGHAFLDAYALTRNKLYFEACSSICRWILSLPREHVGNGLCISYVSFRQDSIHNSNMLGASILARRGAIAGDAECLSVAKRAMIYSCERQLPDGAWFYGESPVHRWIDSFHTAYNLDSLKAYSESTGDDAFRSNLQNGFDYYIRTFFDPSGRPRYYHNRAFPIDIQCASQAITTLSAFADSSPESLDLARRVAAWTIEHMHDKKGYFYYRRLPGITVKIPMHHWGQATMFKALAQLYCAVEARSKQTEAGHLSAA